MASFNNNSFDSMLIQSLMGRLQLRPPYLDTNSFLSQNLDDFLLQDLPNLEADEPPCGGGRERSLLAREEAKLEKEIIRIVHSGGAREALKPNSGQSVAIGEHHICVGFHEEPGSEYRVWEWHGHIMLFDEENGYSPEYIYGNYFERIPSCSKSSGSSAGDGEDDEEKMEKNGGLRDLIGDGKDSAGSRGGRVLHRNSLSAARSAR